MFWKRRKSPKAAAELANDAEIEKLAKEATLGELANEVQVIRQHPGLTHPSGFFDSPGVEMKDDEPYTEPSSSD